MKLKFEKFIDEQELAQNSIDLFEEAIKAYKASLYISSYLLSYMAFYSVIRARILKREHDQPKNCEPKQWLKYVSSMKDDAEWDFALFDILNNKKYSLFCVDDYFRNEIVCWRDKRNQMIHGRTIHINANLVGQFWTFIEDNLYKLHIEGGKDQLYKEITDSFNMRYTTLTHDYTDFVKRIVGVIPQNEYQEFLKKVMDITEYTHNESNATQFLRTYIEFGNPSLIDSIISYVKDRYNIKIIRNFPLIEQYFVEKEVKFLKDMIYSRISYEIAEYYDYLFLLCHNKKLIAHTEYSTIMDKIVAQPAIITSFSKNANFITVLEEEYGLNQALHNKLRSINYKNIKLAIDNETFICFCINYCTVEKYLYDMTYFLRKKLFDYSSLKASIIDELAKPEIAEKYKKFENVHGITQMTDDGYLSPQ